jgi:hypothetical protein
VELMVDWSTAPALSAPANLPRLCVATGAEVSAAWAHPRLLCCPPTSSTLPQQSGLPATATHQPSMMKPCAIWPHLAAR